MTRTPRVTDQNLAEKRKVNISVQGEALVALRKVRDELSTELGFTLSLSQALQRIIAERAK
jgi:hypothetical protein